MNVIALIIALGLCAFIIWQVIGIIKDIKKRLNKNEKKGYKIPSAEVEDEREDNDISLSRNGSEDNQSLEE